MPEVVPERFAVTAHSARVGPARALRRLWRRGYWAAAAVTVALAAAGWGAPGAVFGLGLLACAALKLMELTAGAARGRVVAASYRGDAVVLHDAEGEAVLSPDTAREGHVREAAGRVVLRVETRAGWRHDVTLPDRATAARWLAALGLDAARRKARFVTDRAAVQWVFGYFFGGLFALPGLLLVALLAERLRVRDDLTLVYLATLPGYWLAARSVGRVDVTVGVDGVYAGRGWLRRFFPAASIERAALAPGNPAVLRLTLRTGASHDYRFAAEADAGAARARVEEVLALRAALPTSVVRALGSSAATTPEGWRDVFADALRGASYREAALTADDLARVVGAPGVTAAQRVGAALALREAGAREAGAATGVRVASEALSAPQTVAALTRAERAAARRA